MPATSSGCEKLLDTPGALAPVRIVDYGSDLKLVQSLPSLTTG